VSVKLRSDDKVDRLAHSGSSEWHDRDQSLIRRVDEKRGRLARLQKKIVLLRYETNASWCDQSAL